MCTDVCLPQWHDYILDCPYAEDDTSGDCENQSHEGFEDTTHATLHGGYDAGSPLPDNLDVKVFDPSMNINIPFKLKRSDTADTLIKKYRQMRPELVGSLRLAYNGKRVSGKKTMGELGVKAGAVFITFQRCTGG